MSRKLVLSVLAIGAVVLALVFVLGPRESRVATPGIQAPSEGQDTKRDLLEGRADAEGRVVAEPVDSSATVAPNASVPASGAVRVIVIDLHSAPVQGAVVRAPEESTPAECTTDAQGRCSLPIELGPEPTVKLEIEAEGFFPQHLSVERRTEILIRIGPVATLFGQVIDAETRTPLPRSVLECEACEPMVVTADEHGSFDGLTAPVGFPISIRVTFTDYPTNTFTFELREHGRIRRDVKLDRGREFTGRVFDHESKVPLAGVSVSQHGEGEVRSGPDGGFTARFLPDQRGLVPVVFSLASYCRSTCWLRVPERGQNLEIPLVRSCPVEGVVRDSLGDPVEGAEADISVDYARRPATNSTKLGDTLLWDDLDIPAGETDGAGHFRLSLGIRPWSSWHKVTITHPDHKEATVDLSPAEPGETIWLDITMQSSEGVGSIHGKLTVNGEPRSTTVYWEGATATGVVKSSLDGSYRLESVEAGEVLIGARLEEFGELAEIEGSTAMLNLSAGEDLRHDLEVRASVATISGAVRTSQGEPVPNQMVFARSTELEARAMVRTGADGAYVLSVLGGSARYDVWVQEIWQRGILPGTSGLDFTLPSRSKIYVRALDRSSGNVIPRFELFSRRPGEASYDLVFISMPDQDGWYKLDLLPGPLDLMIPATLGYTRVLRNDVTVADGARVEFELELGQVATFKLADGLAPWLEKFLVLLLEDQAFNTVRRWEENGSLNWDGGELYPGFSAFARQVRFDSDGLAQVRGLDRGLYRFKVFPDELAIAPETVDVGAQTEPIVLRWSAR